MDKPSSKGSRILWLDSLRGLAAFIVAVLHLYEALRNYYPASFFGKTTPLSYLVADFFNLGKVGVVVFFVISGYVIPFTLRNKKISQFLTNRFYRLYPAYWFSIIVLVLVIGVQSVPALLVNLTMFQRFVGMPDINPVFWTLQIELIFYAICIVVYKFGKLFDINFNKRVLLFLLAVSFVVSLFRYFYSVKLPVALPLGLSLMFLGLIVRNADEAGKNLKQSGVLPLVILFIISVFYISLLAYNKDYGFSERWYKYFSSYTLGIILFFLFKHYKLGTTLLQFLANISYSLYLIHPIVLFFCIKMMNSWVLNVATFLLLFFLLSFALSIFSFYCVEKPVLNLVKRKR